QLYQALFWGQLLVFFFFLAKTRGGIENRAALLYIILLATLPVAVIFSVVFYQDIPMTAQIVTSFYFLYKRRWFLSLFFLCLAVGFKISALLFLPVYLILFAVWNFHGSRKVSAIVRISTACIVILSFTWILGDTIQRGSGIPFYPIVSARKVMNQIKYNFSKILEDGNPSKRGKKPPAMRREIKKNGLPVPKGKKNSRIRLGKNTQNQETGLKVTPYEVEIIANHPGDLRIAENYFVYGGAILWLVMLTGIVSIAIRKTKKQSFFASRESSGWIFFVGIFYLVSAAFFLRTAPDARFFLPGILFVILPFVEWTVQLPRPKLIISTIAAIAVLQGGYVFAKVYQLRRVTPEIKEAIGFLQEHPPSPPVIFMYPEGNYRLFPVRHEWYLNYQLREFWRADNDARIQMLHDFGIGAVVIKKHLIAEADPDFINLGIYPSGFVRDLRADPRFKVVFENNGVVIFRVPDIVSDPLTSPKGR
ncbi:MAG: hypothetical protein JRK26_15880, partial [Deltaproteobacteria bacterium]|nr:hypothetical protein [Deltaproteobacteria bacterium]